VLDVADRLERAGFETWCVGGAIRDAVLGHPSLDWDLATAARPAEVQRLFRRTVPKASRSAPLACSTAPACCTR
jgi:tRNA nucleotidyltransferase (CCA-adding enzyme)